MSSTVYFYIKDGKQVGPATIDEIVSLSLPPSTLVKHERAAEWLQIKTVPGFSKYYKNKPEPGFPEKRKGPSFKIMFMRFLAIVFGFFGLILLINVFVEFSIFDLTVGSGLTVLCIFVFKRNKVNHRMTGEEEGMQQGMMMGHIMNMND